MEFKGPPDDGDGAFIAPFDQFPVGKIEITVVGTTADDSQTVVVEADRPPSHAAINVNQVGEGMSVKCRSGCRTLKIDDKWVAHGTMDGPAGTKVELDGKSLTLAAAAQSVDVSLATQIAALPMEGGKLHVSMSVVGPEGGAPADWSWELEAPVSIYGADPGKPLDFGPDDAAPPKPRTLVVLSKTAERKAFGTPPKKYADVDLLAQVEWDEHDVAPACVLFLDGDPNKKREFVRTVTGAKVTVYDRRTGKVQAKKDFPPPPPPPCPKGLDVEKGKGVTAATASVPNETVDTYLKSVVH